MSYTGSQAIAGRGSVLSINTGTPTVPVWTPIGEVKTSQNSGAGWKTADVTNFSSGSNQEFITTIRDNGAFKLSCNYVSTDTGQSALYAAYESVELTMFQLQLPLQGGQTTKGNLYGFTALVETYDFDVEVEKEIGLTVSVKISGPLTLTLGS